MRVISLCGLLVGLSAGQRVNYQVEWSTAGAVLEPAGRADASLTHLGHELLLFGGRTNGTGGSLDLNQSVAFAPPLLMRYNLVQKGWRALNLSGGPGERFGHAAAPLALTGRRALVLFGGFGPAANGSAIALGDQWVLDADASRWHQPGGGGSRPPGPWTSLSELACRWGLLCLVGWGGAAHGNARRLGGTAGLQHDWRAGLHDQLDRADSAGHAHQPDREVRACSHVL